MLFVCCWKVDMRVVKFVGVGLVFVIVLIVILFVVGIFLGVLILIIFVWVESVMGYWLLIDGNVKVSIWLKLILILNDLMLFDFRDCSGIMWLMIDSV